MALITPAVLTAARVKVLNTFNDTIKNSKSFSEINGLLQRVPSGVTNLYQWLAQTNTRMREWAPGTARIVNGVKERAFKAETKRFENTIGISRMDLEANIESGINYLAEISKQRGTSVVKLDDDLVVALLADGQNILCSDGQSFFDVDHPVSLDSTGSQANYVASGCALNAANLFARRAAMASLLDEDGRPFGFVGDTIIVPPAGEKAALETVTAVYGSSGASNVAAGLCTVKVMNDLAGKVSDTTWILVDTKSPGAGPVLVQDIGSPEITDRTAPDSDPVFMRDELEFGARALRAAVPGMWARISKQAA